MCTSYKTVSCQTRVPGIRACAFKEVNKCVGSSHVSATFLPLCLGNTIFSSPNCKRRLETIMLTSLDSSGGRTTQGECDTDLGAAVSIIAIDHELHSCVVQGYIQLLRETDFTIVSLLHLVPTSSLEVESLNSSIEQEIHAQDHAQDQLDRLDKNSASAKPTKLILKSFKEEWLVAREVEAYRRMRSIQGTIVPILYGCCLVNELPTIVLEFIAGEDLVAYECDRDQLPMLARAVEHCSTAISKFGVIQMDPRHDGLIVTDSSKLEVKMIDFSDVDFDKHYTSSMNRCSSHWLMQEYAKHRRWTMPEDVTSWR
ncbi:uncharacterized protein K489DRAFT_372349 [Dissoconium aciculare CBS 342.82]|uniref:Protein kinase domain-containing protein n=1 Tax=Dissoconium aciculare CBS 342.82 TaxID=1314786 RepID=A0A6J3LY20_9PEZI|nr:uncharacterized protein K489DRAFT_372349 [Dissoconium aciculare CBS 342.82]KAF1820568.1 hypothetical protein K489DRAFT_372349 [Dissoconium aciculare CBS 342.82]